MVQFSLNSSFLLQLRYYFHCCARTCKGSEKMVLRSDIGYSNYYSLHSVEILYPDTGAVHVPEILV